MTSYSPSLLSYRGLGCKSDNKIWAKSWWRILTTTVHASIKKNWRRNRREKFHSLKCSSDSTCDSLSKAIRLLLHFLRVVSSLRMAAQRHAERNFEGAKLHFTSLSYVFVHKCVAAPTKVKCDDDDDEVKLSCAVRPFRNWLQIANVFFCFAVTTRSTLGLNSTDFFLPFFLWFHFAQNEKDKLRGRGMERAARQTRHELGPRCVYLDEPAIVLNVFERADL